MSKQILSTILTVALGFGLYATVPVVGDYNAASASVIQDKETKRKPKGKAKRIKVLTTATAKKIGKVAEYYELKDLTSAMNELLDLKSDKYDTGKLNGYDSAIMWQYIGIIRYEQEDLNGTIQAYEKFLSHKEDVHEGLILSMTYGLGQLYFSQAMDLDGAAQTRQLRKSLNILKIWENQSTTVSVSQYYFLSQINYALEDFKEVLRYIDIVIKEAGLANLEIKEGWYRTRLSAYYEMENFEQVKNTLISLLINWPKPSYWWQLSSTYNTLENETAFYALTEAIYNQGYFDKSSHYTMMAQIFMAQDVPIKAAWIIEFALKEEILERDESTLKLLGQSYLLSQEYEKAVAPLSRVATLAKDYQMWMQVGQVQQSLDNMQGASDAFSKSLAIIPSKERKDKFAITVLKGNVQTEMRQYANAKKTFADATKLAQGNTESRQMTRWNKYLAAEEKRWELMQP